MYGDLQAIIESKQVGLKNLMLSHACKWIRATLRVKIASLAGMSMNENLITKKTYAFWHTNNGVHCAVSLKELVAACVVVLAHELDNLV